MITSLKVSGFILLVVLLIAGFASMIPQVQSPAPEALEISGDLSGPELAESGRQVFESAEAGCVACHAIGREGLRAPDLAEIGVTATERVPGQSAEEYLYESLRDPCAFVMEGYDCIMPPTLAQALGPAKITALVAYLQSLGGEITVSLSEETASAATEGGQAGVAGETAEEIIVNAGCTACHTLETIGVEGAVGPALSDIGARLTPDEIRQSILEPDAVIAENCPTGECLPGVMPVTLADQLSARQLEAVVTYLSNLGGPIDESTATSSP